MHRRSRVSEACLGGPILCLCVLWGEGGGGEICIIKSAIIILSGFLRLSLQISMNVSKALITVIKMQLASTLKEVSCALVTLDTLAVDLHARVNASINLLL